jgi:hypothetical protein
VSVDRRLIGAINILCPGGRVVIRAAAEPGKEIQIKMIVSVDQPRENEKSVQVQNMASLCVK